MNRRLFFATFAYWLFVIYGSLVPLEFKYIPFATASSQFANIQNLNLGAESRADWIANIVLYIPLAFAASASFSGIRYPIIRAFLSVLVLLFCLATAVGIEFTQLYFPQRTVSQNDLVAETLGTVAGVVGWQFFGGYFLNLYAQLRGSLVSAQAAIVFYLLVYIALSLFPYDFVTSFDELSVKLGQGNDAVVLPFDVCASEPLRCGVKLWVEMLVLMPLGILFCCIPYLRNPLAVVVLVGFFLGLIIEMTQVFLISGNAQGLSVLTRMVGMGAGASLFAWAKQHDFGDIMRQLRRGVGMAVVPYLLLVLSVNGWFAGGWLSSQEALHKLAETHFLPLYYFYFTSESVAFVSLLSNIGLYVPVGVLCWLGFFKQGREEGRYAPHWAYVGLLAAVFALVVEAGKLFLADKHADPSDVWLAFIAAAVCYELLNRLPQWLAHDKTVMPAIFAEPLVVVPEKPVATVLPAEETNKNWRVLSFLLWGVIAVKLSGYPIGAVAVALGVSFLAYTLLLRRFPYIWLIVVPALLPIMDFTPWTGRFFFDEFDLLILATLAFYYWQKPKARTRTLLSVASLFLLVSFTLFYTVSLFKGLLPLPAIDANAFSNYYSHYNSLRVAKGFFWSLLLLPLLQLTLRRYPYARHYFAYGVLLGLAGVSLFTVIERMVFVSLLDFASDYRINGLFSTMHVGGGHFESYLMLALPFIAVLFVEPRPKPINICAGVGLFIGGFYALLATFSRGGLIGFAIAFVVLLLALLVCYRKRFRFTKSLLLLVPLLVAAVLMALPVLRGSLFQQRLEAVGQDRDSREYHWRDALAMMDDDLGTGMFGMGLGSYPRTFFWLNTENIRPGTYETATENGNHYLRLRGGDALFMGQYVAVEAHTDYRLVMDVRGETAHLTLNASLCEKSVQYSIRCSSVDTVTAKPGWGHVEQTLNSGNVGGPVVGGWLKRPVQLAFFNGDATGKLLDVDNVQLLDKNGDNAVANGDFSKGGDFWFFATEKHNPWHIFNFWVHLLFDQGWLGAGAFVLLFANGLFTCYRKLRRQDLFAAITLAAFSGFMVVGWVDSPFDAPRLTLLFFLLLFLALLRTPSAWAQPHKRKLS
ncbi:MAG: hypothetical protein CTY16_02290 [Methylobacter sp.]|nr:MAG: hypothetical protein CTY16_02290 [Methylobacter sp.]